MIAPPPTKHEEDAIHWMRWLRGEPRIETTRKWKLGRLEVTYNRRSRKNAMGRFGGGWMWSLGIQIGGTTAIVNCLVFSLRFHLPRRTRK